MKGDIGWPRKAGGSIMNEKLYQWCDINGVMDCSVPLTLKECFEDAIDNGFTKGEMILVGELRKHEMNFCVEGVADCIIENLEEDADCDIDINLNEITALQQRLQKVIEDWIAEFDIGGNIYDVIKTDKCIIP